MSINRELADRFSHMAAVLELNGANKFRVIAYQKGARVLGDLPEDLGERAHDAASLTEIEGIGKGLAEKIVEYVETGRIEEIDRELAKVPAGVLELLEIPGLGPKTVQTLWQAGEVESVADLKARLDSGELEDLPRLGAKSLEKIRKSIEFAESSGGRVMIGVALAVAERIVGVLGRLKAVRRVDYAGSLRRGRETIGDVDILAACDDPERDGAAISGAFREMDGVVEVLAAGATKSSVRLEGGLQADLRLVPTDRYGAALLYFTGSKQHNVTLRERAIKRKLRLNEYGLWKSGDEKREGGEPVAAETEEAIYKRLGLAWIEPEMREDRGEVAAAEAGELPVLVKLSDIRAELHAHTTASDGKWSIEALAQACAERGFHTVAVTDHSHSQAVANGLDASRLKRHIKAIRKADEKVKGIRILAGTEVDILGDGHLDYEDALLAELDLVVASPHVALTQDPKKATERLLRAIENPYVHIIGHPTGRLVNRREGLHPSMERLFKASAETATVLEINANQWRLDLRDVHARAAIEAGVKLAINTDAHHVDHLDQLVFGVKTARRAWATKKDIVNCMTATQLGKWLGAKRKKMGV